MQRAVCVGLSTVDWAPTAGLRSEEADGGGHEAFEVSRNDGFVDLYEGAVYCVVWGGVCAVALWCWCSAGLSHVGMCLPHSRLADKGAAQGTFFLVWGGCVRGGCGCAEWLRFARPLLPALMCEC